MDLSLTPDQEPFRATVRSGLKTNMPREWKPTGSSEIPRAGQYDFLRRWQRTLFDAGYIGLTWPKEYGGGGLTFMEELILQQEMALAKAPPILNVLGVGMGGPTIIAWGNEEQKKRYPPKILSCEEIWCQGYSEPNAGSDLASLQTRAVKDGEHWVVNGQKVWTSFAHVADYMMLLARTDPSVPKHKGITYFLLDMKLPGVTVKPLRQITGEAEFNEVFFDNVRVHESEVLGGVNNGWAVGLTTLMYERLTLGFGLQMRLRIALDGLIDLARQMEKSGRALTKEPVMRQKLAQIWIETECLKYTGARAITKLLRVRQGAHGRARGRDRRVLVQAGRAGLARPGLRRGIRRLRARVRRPDGVDGGDGPGGHARPVLRHHAARRLGHPRGGVGGPEEGVAHADRVGAGQDHAGLDGAERALGRRRRHVQGPREQGRVRAERHEALRARRAPGRRARGGRADERGPDAGGWHEPLPGAEGHERREREALAHDGSDAQALLGHLQGRDGAGRRADGGQGRGLADADARRRARDGGALRRDVRRCTARARHDDGVREDPDRLRQAHRHLPGRQAPRRRHARRRREREVAHVLRRVGGRRERARGRAGRLDGPGVRHRRVPEGRRRRHPAPRRHRLHVGARPAPLLQARQVVRVHVRRRHVSSGAGRAAD